MAELTQTQTTPKPDRQKAWDAITAKTTPYTTLYGYYDGDQPAVYTIEHIRKVFGPNAERFVQNWCAVVIDSATDRMQLLEFGVADEEENVEETQAEEGAEVAEVEADTTIDDALQALWDDNLLGLLSDDVHEGSLITGESYAIVWPAEDTGEVEIYYNDPRLCHIQYDPERPRVKLWAAKMWLDEDGYYRLTMYYTDRFEYWQSTKKADQTIGPDGWKNFRPMEPPTAPNDTGQIPVFQYSINRRIKSDLRNVTPLQNSINRMLTDMMVAGTYGAFKQRYIMSNQPTENLRNAPNENWHLDEGSTVGEFSATELSNYLGALDSISSSIGAISRTPMHYFFKEAGANVSGEALIALEAPLNAKIASFIERFTATWQEVVSYALSLMGIEVAATDILVMYDEPATVQPRTEAEIVGLERAAGVPLLSALRRRGAKVSELEQVEEELAEEKAAAPAMTGGLNMRAGLEQVVAGVGVAEESEEA